MTAARPLVPLTRLRRRLAARFAGLAEHLAGYSARVEKECAAFPEGDLLPYVFPAIGLSVPGADRAPAPRELAAADVLIQPAIRAVERHVGRSAEHLEPGSDNAVYPGWLLLALALRERAAEAGPHRSIRRALAKALLADLEARGGGPMASFAGIYWPFDTVPVLLGLQFSDELDGHDASRAAVRRFLDWMAGEGTEPASGLPLSRVQPGRSGGERPRGCDLSLRIALTRLLDPALARRHYVAYTRHFWQEHGWVAGFREHPHGRTGGADIDSGPIIHGLGVAASAFGIAGAASMGDRWRTWRLCSQLGAVRAALWSVTLGRSRGFPSAVTGRIPIPLDPRAVTGFLFGDVCLFLTLSWPALARERAGALPPRD